MPIYAVEYTYSGDEDARDRSRPEHRAYLASLAEQGVVLASGPFAPGQAPGALVVVSAESKEEVRRVVEDDPFRVHGVLKDYRVTEWEPIIGRWAASLP
jgi:uncharacterized protein YciI